MRSVFDSRTLRNMFGLKKEEITGGCRELYNEFVICYSPHFIRMIRPEDGIGVSSCTRGREYKYLEGFCGKVRRRKKTTHAPPTTSDSKLKSKAIPNYKPELGQRAPGGLGSQISRHSALEGGKVVSPTHRPHLPSRKYAWYSSLLEAESTPGS